MGGKKKLKCGGFPAVEDLGRSHSRSTKAMKGRWPEAQQKQRLQEIRAMIAMLPTAEIAIYENEIDIHLDPKIG